MTWQLVLFCCSCILWCSLHSLLISRAVSSRIKERLGVYGRYYRLLYNVISLLSLLPLIIYIHLNPCSVMFWWTGYFVVIRWLCLLIALLCFLLGSRRYDFHTFLGINQIRSGHDQHLLSGEQVFSRQGILGIIRHPWYAGSVLFIWSVLGEYSQAACVAGAVFTLYLFAGACLEERRLLGMFGASYRQYQQEVSMFIPWKWLKMKFSGENNGSR